ncbi:hypothetical protein Np050604_165 [Cyanophage S-RIM44]|uniref:Uncharacterized protein n=2 Tax=Vellamovirus TaxID=2733139 RepID=A0A127KN99_9CAUD|nr:hypothetical protein Syn1_167 [Prochlorococcus phage Syn1]YP_009783309.1 hypothetical protein HOQ83_gp094 [Cyanophage S-RIM44]ADO99268.1 hypothetical protein Syn1_167 [Prochlorococcus phage Syn1]AMO43409.1 hypothetical protein W270710_165 [Cyanophage S-RIM44]AOO11653.1 hypothetical protein ES420910_172 [Cyanophage S-RIM44]AOO11881.1 hypothetical protein Np050604_165 [Cyanophage S-RIM44]AOO12119.1 hypothetical protein Np200711_173 [Cyanophage S-RIM44]
MIINELTPENWIFFAIKHYNNPQSVTYSDFEEDLNRIRYIKRLFKRYESSGELKTHLILNHIIVMYNVFDDAATPLLFYKTEATHWSYLKAFLLFLERLPDSLNDNVNQECLSQLNLI